MTNAKQIAYFTALQWHLDQGIDEVLADEPGRQMIRSSDNPMTRENDSAPAPAPAPAPQTIMDDLPSNPSGHPVIQPSDHLIQGTPAFREEAIKCAMAANSLEALQAALAGFEGLAIRKTATNLVFCDGNPSAPIMLIGEAPGADEDRLGRPFVGVSGQLLDKILKCIDLDRTATDAGKSIYIANVLNWRPPGNRTPSPQEVEISLPFIERHIALVKPRLLVLCGGVSAKALLNTEESISRLRGRWHDYTPRTPGIEMTPIPAICTYHPSYLLRTPSQKKAVWGDMLALMQKRQELGIAAKAA